jgi:predicted metalloprotease with PDZ domain
MIPKNHNYPHSSAFHLHSEFHMQYHITPEPARHLLHIELTVEGLHTATLELQLPAWRPGRYELANYAKNVLRLEAFSSDDQPLAVRKLTKDRWLVHPGGAGTVKVRYRYYAHQMDAGNSWVDDSCVYINFINCLLYAEDRLEEPCRVHLQLPPGYQVACGLPQPGPGRLEAESYYRLVDSPLVASADLHHRAYVVDGHRFHVWVQGSVHFDWEQLLNDFRGFTRAQMQMLGGFPCPDYHFLLHALPDKHYHGVEHWNSTVMTLGPAEKIAAELYPELIGLASHELFHVWNVIRIRPAELLPYDFSRENYFPTGYVAEGLTTYYGDLLLARSGFFSPAQYLAELNGTLNRHFMSSNEAALSLTESSLDLWLDGYVAGVPGRKVSIYHKGALTALILDLEIRRLTDDACSLDDVVQDLWERYGQKNIGYSHADYVALVEEVAGRPMGDYFQACITGTTPLQERLAAALRHVGCTLAITPQPGDGCNVQVAIAIEAETESMRKWLGIPATPETIASSENA